MLPMTLIPGDSGSALDLGGFGYRANDPGPGVDGRFPAGEVQRAAKSGRPPGGARRQADRKRAPVDADPGKSRRYPGRRGNGAARQGSHTHRDPHGGSAPRSGSHGAREGRVHAGVSPDRRSSAASVTEMRVTHSAEWVPGDLLWNGLTLENVKTAGCYALKLEKELLHAGPCQ